MSETRSSGSSTPSPYEQPFPAVQSGMNSSLYTKTADDGADQPAAAGIPPDELIVFRDFITKHLRAIGNADVQCMLVWAEWVRFHVRETRKFPRLILEQEFKDIVTGLFNTTVSLDERRGRVYPGIRFVS